MNKRNVLTIIIAAAVLVLIVIMIIQLFPLIREVFKDSSDESKMVKYIDSYGMKGVPVLIGLQALQVIVAVIPSAAIQVLTGICYGAYWGTLVNVAGSILGNILVFTAMRQLSTLLSPFFKHKNKHKKFLSKERLSKMKRPELIAFFFFLIPGIPNGIVPYVFAETDISLPRYLIAVIGGVVPSTFICTFMGDRVSKGSYTSAIIIFAVILVVFIIVMIFKNKIMKKITDSNTGTADTTEATDAANQ